MTTFALTFAHLAFLSKESDLLAHAKEAMMFEETVNEQAAKGYQPRWVGPNLGWVVWDSECAKIVAFGASGQRAADKADALND